MCVHLSKVPADLRPPRRMTTAEWPRGPTSKKGVPSGSASATACFHSRGWRSGLKSETTALSSCRRAKAGTSAAAAPCSRTNGMERERRSRSTSCSPPSRKPEERRVAGSLMAPAPMQ